MKILYLSCHAILEYDELKMLTELGYTVDSHGAYRDPRGAYTLPRPGIPGMVFNQEFFDYTALHPKTELSKELVDQYDLIIIMSGENETALTANWQRIKHKRVILRMIGQTTPSTESMLKRYRAEGLQIVRYSPKESNIPGYAGGDAIIRFGKDPDEFKGWVGDDVRPINFTQTLKGRNKFTHYDEVMGALVGFPGAKVYGNGNTDLGSFNGGEMPYDELKRLMRAARCYVYAGSWPAPYTLSFIEAMMTGIPIVGIDESMAHVRELEQFNFYEAGDILRMAGNRPCTSVEEMRNMIQLYIDRPDLAAMQGKEQREVAVALFGTDVIKKQWQEFIETGKTEEVHYVGEIKG